MSKAIISCRPLLNWLNCINDEDRKVALYGIFSVAGVSIDVIFANSGLRHVTCSDD